LLIKAWENTLRFIMLHTLRNGNRIIEYRLSSRCFVPSVLSGVNQIMTMHEESCGV